MEIIGDYLYTNDPHVNIYTKGDFQDYQFITLDKGIPEGSSGSVIAEAVGERQSAIGSRQCAEALAIRI